jgi:hypothetical protein
LCRKEREKEKSKEKPTNTQMPIRGKVIYFRHGPYSTAVVEGIVRRFVKLMTSKPEYSSEDTYFVFHPLPKKKTQEEYEKRARDVPMGYGYIFVRSTVLFNMIVWGKYEVEEDYGKRVKVNGVSCTIGTKKYETRRKEVQDELSKLEVVEDTSWAEDDVEVIIDTKRFDETLERNPELEFKPPILSEEQKEWVNIYNRERRENPTPKAEKELIPVFKRNEKGERIEAGKIFPIVAFPGKAGFRPESQVTQVAKIYGSSLKASEVNAILRDIEEKIVNFSDDANFTTDLLNERVNLHEIKVEFRNHEDSIYFHYMYKKIRYEFEGGNGTEIVFTYLDPSAVNRGGYSRQKRR